MQRRSGCSEAWLPIRVEFRVLPIDAKYQMSGDDADDVGKCATAFILLFAFRQFTDDAVERAEWAIQSKCGRHETRRDVHLHDAGIAPGIVFNPAIIG